MLVYIWKSTPVPSSVVSSIEEDLVSWCSTHALFVSELSLADVETGLLMALWLFPAL